MPGVLEGAQPHQHDAVAEVDVRARRIDAQLDPQRRSGGDLLGEPAGRKDVDRARRQGLHRGLVGRRRGLLGGHRPMLDSAAGRQGFRSQLTLHATGPSAAAYRPPSDGIRIEQPTFRPALRAPQDLAARPRPRPRGPGLERAADPAAAAQAPLRARHPRARPARVRLLDLRDHDGGRPGPAGAREPRAVRARPELGRLRRQRPQARDADQQPGPDPALDRGDLAVDEGGGRRDRGHPLLRAPRRRLPGHGARPLPGRPLRLRPAGRVDDHPAVRQERARRAGGPDDPAEVPRGGDRLPPRAPVVEGQDPHRVPERDLLRRGRDRDRGRRAHLLRRPARARRLRRGRRRDPVRVRAAAVGVGAARRDHLLAERLLAAHEPDRRHRAPQPRARQDGGAGQHHPRGGRSVQAAGRSRSRTRSCRRRRTPRPPTSPPGCASSSSTATAPARRSAAASRSSRRSTSTSSAASRRSPAGASRGSGSRPRSSSSTTTPPRCGRWSAASTTRTRRSTWRPTASASPAPRSSRSP